MGSRITREYKDLPSLFPELSGRSCTLRIHNKERLEPMDLSRIFAALALEVPHLDLSKTEINSDSVEVFIPDIKRKAIP